MGRTRRPPSAVRARSISARKFLTTNSRASTRGSSIPGGALVETAARLRSNTTSPHSTYALLLFEACFAPSSDLKSLSGLLQTACVKTSTLARVFERLLAWAGRPRPHGAPAVRRGAAAQPLPPLQHRRAPRGPASPGAARALPAGACGLPHAAFPLTHGWLPTMLTACRRRPAMPSLAGTGPARTCRAERGRRARRGASARARRHRHRQTRRPWGGAPQCLSRPAQ